MNTEERIQEQVISILKDYGYEHPFPTEPYLLCQRWVEGKNNSHESYLAFLKLAKPQKRRTDAQKYREMSR